MQGCVYLLRNLKNGKGYVGQHGGAFAEKRWDRHIKAAFNYGSKLPLHCAIRKYGVKGFSAEVIWRGPMNRLDEFEIKFIKKLRTFAGDSCGAGGYNLTLGGKTTRGFKFTKASCKKISKSKKGRPLTEETKLNMSVSRKAWWLSHPNKAKKIVANIVKATRKRAASGNYFSAATRKQIADSLRGRKNGPLTKEHKAKISVGVTGVVRTPIWCRRISKANKGRVPWNKGLNLARAA